MSAGIDNLVYPTEEAMERTAKFNSSNAVNTSDKKWRDGELEFEAEMRMLDNAVSSFILSTILQAVHNNLERNILWTQNSTLHT